MGIPQRGGIDQQLIDLQIGILLDDLEGHAPEQAAGLFEDVGLVDDGREGIDRHVVQQHVDLDQVAAVVPGRLLVEAGVPLGP